MFNRPFCGTCGNSADQDQTPQNAVSDQGLHCLLTVCSIKYEMKMKNTAERKWTGPIDNSGKFHSAIMV